MSRFPDYFSKTPDLSKSREKFSLDPLDYPSNPNDYGTPPIEDAVSLGSLGITPVSEALSLGDLGQSPIGQMRGVSPVRRPSSFPGVDQDENILPAGVKVKMSDYGLQSDNKNSKYDPDANLNRISTTVIKVKGVDHTFNRSKYKNRHLVLPDDLDPEAYYKIDIQAKNKTYRNKWVKVLGHKWVGQSKKLAWYCRQVDNGTKIYSLYINGLSRFIKEEDEDEPESVISEEVRLRIVDNLTKALAELQ
jgi:hypothetical protein